MRFAVIGRHDNDVWVIAGGFSSQEAAVNETKKERLDQLANRIEYISYGSEAELQQKLANIRPARSRPDVRGGKPITVMHKPGGDVVLSPEKSLAFFQRQDELRRERGVFYPNELKTLAEGLRQDTMRSVRSKQEQLSLYQKQEKVMINADRHTNTGGFSGVQLDKLSVLPQEKTGFEKRVQRLTEAEKKYFTSPGFQRIEDTASLLTFGRGKPLEQRSWVGQSSEILLRNVMAAGPGVVGVSYFTGGKLMAAGEGLIKSPKNTMHELFKEAPRNVKKSGIFDPRTPQGFSTFLLAGIAALPKGIKAYQTAKTTKFDIEFSGSREVLVGKTKPGSVLKGRPIEGTVFLTEPELGYGTARFKYGKYDIFQETGPKGTKTTVTRPELQDFAFRQRKDIPSLDRKDVIVSRSFSPTKKGEPISLKQISQARKQEVLGVRQVPEEHISILVNREVVQTKYKGYELGVSPKRVQQEGIAILQTTKVGQKTFATDKYIFSESADLVADLNKNKLFFETTSKSTETLKPEFVFENVERAPDMLLFESTKTGAKAAFSFESRSVSKAASYETLKAKYLFIEEPKPLFAGKKAQTQFSQFERSYMRKPSKVTVKSFKTTKPSVSFYGPKSLMDLNFTKVKRFPVVSTRKKPRSALFTGAELDLDEMSKIKSTFDTDIKKKIESKPLIDMETKTDLRTLVDLRSAISTKVDIRSKPEETTKQDYRYLVPVPKWEGTPNPKRRPRKEPPKTPLPLGFDFKLRKGKDKKPKGKSRKFKWSPEYVSSVRAAAFGLYGKKPKFITGVTLRPLLKKKIKKKKKR